MPKTKYSKCIETFWVLAFMFTPLIVISWNLDSDIWFLLNHGRYVVEKGIPFVEPFTIHNEWNFIMQQWFSSVLMWKVYSTFGKWGLIGIVYVVAVIIDILIYKLCMLVSKGKFYLSVFITTVVMLCMCLWFMVTRPQIFSYVFLITELIFLEKYRETEKRGYLFPIIILSIFEINFHASYWCLLFAFLLPYLIDDLRKKKINVLMVAVLMGLGGFLNPYSYKAITYLFQSYGKENVSLYVGEMGAPSIASLHGCVFFVLIFLEVLCFIWNRNGKLQLRFFFLFIGTIFMTLSAIKSMAYFLLASSVVMSDFLKNKADKLVFRSHRKDLVLLVVTVALIYTAGAINNISKYEAAKDYPKERKAIDYLAENENCETVKLYTNYNNGAYAEYKKMKVYFDARAEVFFEDNNGKANVFSEYIELQRGHIHYKEFLDKYDFTHILAEKNDLLYTYLEDDESYELLYKDEDCRIYKICTK